MSSSHYRHTIQKSRKAKNTGFENAILRAYPTHLGEFYSHIPENNLGKTYRVEATKRNLENLRASLPTFSGEIVKNKKGQHQLRFERPFPTTNAVIAALPGKYRKNVITTMNPDQPVSIHVPVTKEYIRFLSEYFGSSSRRR